MSASPIMVAGEVTNMSRTGRPPLGEQRLVRYTVYMTPEQALSATTAGSGNVSEGIRLQLLELVAYREWHAAQLALATQPAVVPRSRHQ